MNSKLTISQLEQYLSKAAWILQGPVDASDFKVYIFPCYLHYSISKKQISRFGSISNKFNV